MKTLFILLTFVTLVSCSEDSITSLAKGEFRGELTGAIERKLVADALFLVVSDTTNNEEELSLNFITGQIENRGPESYPIYTGFFLSVPWDKKIGVIGLGNDGFLTSSIVYPYKILQYQTGKITIDNFNDNQIEGSIYINALDNNSTEKDNEVTISGRFIATNGSSSTN
ncbi:MAG: hypothetical protein ABJR05_03305 [Balneola sp.]